MGEPLRIDDLARRVSDGEAVDWAAERARATDARELRLVEALQSLDQIAVALRSSGASVADSAEQVTRVQDDSLIGSLVGEYRVDRFVGEGGMGRVYKAYDPSLERWVAVKVLHPEMAANEAACRRFLLTTRLACRVEHAYVAQIKHVLSQDQRVFVIMEWIDGPSIEQLLASGPLPWRWVAELGAEIAEALEAVHRAGVVHRDLKPANVMLAPDRHIRVLDFGIALHVFQMPGDRLTASDHRVGTLRYMSPEQVRGVEGLDARSDLFALGILLWEMLTGAHPFSRETAYETAAAILNDPPGSMDDADSLQNQPRLRAVVLKLLEKDPAARYASAAEVVTELRAIASTADAIVPEAVPRRRSSRRLWAAPAIAVVAVLAVYGIWKWIHTVHVHPSTLPVVAVLPFDDRDGGAGSLRGELVASLAGAGLSESGAVRPVDLDRITQALGASPQASAVVSDPSRVNAGFVVAGQVWTESGTLAGTMSIYKAGSSEPIAQHPLRAGGPSGLAAIVAARTLESVAPSYRGDAPEKAATSTRSDEAIEQLQRARASLRLADYGAAIAALERAVSIDPSFVEARTALAGALDAAGWGRRSRDEAAHALADAERAGSSLPARVTLEARAVKAEVEEKTDDERAARKELTTRYRDDPALLASYADALRRAGQLQEATGTIALAEALDPDDLRVSLVKASVLTSSTKYDEAAAVLAKAESALLPTSPAFTRGSVAMQQGQIEMTRGAYAAAVDRYTVAEKQFDAAGAPVREAQAHRSVLDARVAGGKTAVTSKEYDAVLTQFRSAGDVVEVIDVLAAVGARDLQAGDIAQAEPTLRAALQEGRILENPRLTLYPQLNLAALLNSSGRLAEAEGLATEAVETSRQLAMRDTEAFALTILAAAKTGKGRLVEARDAFLAIVQMARSPGPIRDQLAFALMCVADLDETMGQPTKGLEAADESVKDLRANKQDVLLADALIVRSRLRSQMADWDGADADLTEAQTLAKASGVGQDQTLRLSNAKGAALLRRGRFSEAMKEFDLVRKAKTDSDTILPPAAIGSCHSNLALSRLDEAAAACRAADEDKRAIPSERCQAHALMAEIALRRKQSDDAERWARRAAGEAREASMVPAELRALSVLSAMSRIADRDEILRRGSDLVASYLEAVPETRRDAVRDRADWKEEIHRFTTQGGR